MTMQKPAALIVKAGENGAIFQVRVTPRASRTSLTGLWGEGNDLVLKITLQAPAVEGRANAALIEFLRDLLDAPRTAIEIVGAQHARTKTIVVRGQSADRTAAKLEAALAAVRRPSR